MKLYVVIEALDWRHSFGAHSTMVYTALQQLICCLQYIYSSLAGFTTPLNQSQAIMYDLCRLRIYVGPYLEMRNLIIPTSLF